MGRRTISIGAIAVVVLAAALLVPYAWRRLERWGVSIHQRSVTRSLAEWGSEYGQVHTWEEAERSIGMLGYVQWYYVPGPGYRSDEKTEGELEAQRARTVRAIISALKEFTGQDFGADTEQWAEWVRKARQAEGPERNGHKASQKN
jgi:hypothetical protein